MSQHLVFANCIPLVIKFFNQTILAYVQARNNIATLDFPHCVITEQVELTAETLVSLLNPAALRLSSPVITISTRNHTVYCSLLENLLVSQKLLEALKSMNLLVKPVWF